MAKRRAKVSKSSKSCAPCKSSCCCACWGWIVLILGVIYLLQDLGALARWGLNWPLEWWTVAFVLVGLKGLVLSYSK